MASGAITGFNINYAPELQQQINVSRELAKSGPKLNVLEQDQFVKKAEKIISDVASEHSNALTTQGIKANIEKTVESAVSKNNVESAIKETAESVASKNNVESAIKETAESVASKNKSTFSKAVDNFKNLSGGKKAALVTAAVAAAGVGVAAIVNHFKNNKTEETSTTSFPIQGGYVI